VANTDRKAWQNAETKLSNHRLTKILAHTDRKFLRFQQKQKAHQLLDAPSWRENFNKLMDFVLKKSGFVVRTPAENISGLNSPECNHRI